MNQDRNNKGAFLPPQEQFKLAAGSLYAFAIIGAVYVSVVRLVPDGISLGIIFFVVSLAIAFWVQKRQSILGLGLAFGVAVGFVLHELLRTLQLLIAQLQIGNSIIFTPLMAVLAYFMFQGFGAIRQLKSAAGDGGEE